MATLHSMHGTWFCIGASITVSGARAVQQGMPPQKLFHVDRVIAGKKTITVARHINGEEVAVDPRASSADQLAWLSHTGEHVRAWMKGVGISDTNTT